MKRSTDSGKKEKKGSDPPLSLGRFLILTGVYYGLMLALYLYFMLANLSMAPKFVYTQF